MTDLQQKLIEKGYAPIPSVLASARWEFQKQGANGVMFSVVAFQDGTLEFEGWGLVDCEAYPYKRPFRGSHRAGLDENSLIANLEFLERDTVQMIGRENRFQANV